jgi:uncharacterized glyoxalase superfamily protein PhnB
MTIARITPVLAVPEVKPCVKFWVEGMGFEVTAEVPDGETIGFAILEKNGVEHRSGQCGDCGSGAQSKTFLYVEVNNLDDVIGAMKGTEIAMPLRTTFYGMRELGVKDPAGHVITFAQKASDAK